MYYHRRPHQTSNQCIGTLSKPGARCHAMVSIPPLPHGAWPDLAPELVASERHEGIQCRAKVTEENSE